MSEKKYFVFMKNAFSSDLQKVGYDKEGNVHRPMTMREYLDRTFKHLLRITPETFVPVKGSDFISDYTHGPKESFYIKRLGWDYAKAASLVSERGSILMYTCNPSGSWRFIALDDYMHNDDIAFRIIREIEDSVGLETVFVECDSEGKPLAK